MNNRFDRFPWVAGAAAAILILAVLVAAMNGRREKGDAAEEAPPVRTSRTQVNSGDEDHRSVFRRSSKVRSSGILDRNRMIVQVSPRHVLATVNGTPIRLHHLVSVKSEGGELAMESGRLRSRLERAIEAELVIQEAEARGIGLTESQQKRLDQIAAVHEANLEELKPYGLSWDSLSEEQVDLERRLTGAMLLRQNLVAASDAVAPSPDREEQARYEEALRRMLRDLKAGAEIDDLSTRPPLTPARRPVLEP